MLQLSSHFRVRDKTFPTHLLLSHELFPTFVSNCSRKARSLTSSKTSTRAWCCSRILTTLRWPSSLAISSAESPFWTYTDRQLIDPHICVCKDVFAPYFLKFSRIFVKKFSEQCRKLKDFLRHITHTTVVRPLYRTTCVSRHPQLRTAGFCWSKVLLAVCPSATSAFGLGRRR